MHFYTFDKDRYYQHIEMCDWCRENYGPGKWIVEPYPTEWRGLPDWTVHSMFGRTSFAFKNEKDYTWFLLRWA